MSKLHIYRLTLNLDNFDQFLDGDVTTYVIEMVQLLPDSSHSGFSIS